MNGLAAGALSGLTTTLLLQPFEVIKTRVQENNQHSSLQIARKPGVADAFKAITRTSGAVGLWRGTGMTQRAYHILIN